MKKTLLFAVMAGAALAGCVKNEEVAMSNDGSPDRITFDAPVVRIPTRATEIEDNYPKDKDFAVYALHTPSSITLPATSATGSTAFMTNEKCVADNATTPTCWVPADRNYYWPKNGVLHFGAYAPATTATNAVEWDAFSGFKFNDYTINSTPTNQIDLLYSDPAYNKTKADNVTDAPYDGITLLFKHALSSIVFTANANASYGDDKISITKIEVKNVYQQGDFAQNFYVDNSGSVTSGKASWTTEGSLTNYVVFEGDKELDLVTTNTDGGTTTTVYEPINGTLDPTAGDGKRRSDLIVMPQKLNGGAGGRGQGIADATVDITYKITHSYKDKNNTAVKETTTETVTFKLAVKDNNTDTDGDPQYVWEMGKRYTYHIMIGLDQIYFNPTVTPWDDEEGELVKDNTPIQVI